MLVGGLFASPDKERFEKAYADLRDAMRQKPWVSNWLLLPEYDRIKALGPKAAPYMIEKMSTDEYGFLMGTPLHRITKKSFRDDPEKVKRVKDGGAHAHAKLYIKWWYEERALTPSLFSEYYEKWTAYKEAYDPKNATLMLQKIENLGIDILPLLSAKENLPHEFFPMLCRLTNDNLTTCLEDAWKKFWEAEKEKYLMPEGEVKEKGSVLLYRERKEGKGKRSV